MNRKLTCLLLISSVLIYVPESFSQVEDLPNDHSYKENYYDNGHPTGHVIHLENNRGANDDICSAATLTVGGGCVGGDNTGGSTEGLSTPSCWSGPPTNYSDSEWFSFVATDDSMTINFDGLGWST